MFLTSWSKAEDIPYWNINVPQAGKYRVTISYASTKPSLGEEYSVLDGGASLSAKVTKASGEWVFGQDQIGELALPAGASTVKIKIAGKEGRDVMQLERLTLQRVSP